eukprot:g1141.t1
MLPFASRVDASTDGSASFLAAGADPSASLRAAALRSDVSVVVPGEVIAADSSKFLRGHGTFIDGQGRLVASIAGIVERVNKLISVRPPQARYSGEVGDVVVGRVVEVLQKRWLVDIGGYQSSVLLLTSVNLPSGQQRRRTSEDQLQMRELYAEGDVISAEIQSFFRDGAASIHARNLKYGKLSNGQLVVVKPALIPRLKQHFVELPQLGLEVILGKNGHIWITAAYEKNEGDGGRSASGASASRKRADNTANVRNVQLMQRRRKDQADRVLGAEVRESIALLRNVLLLLEQRFCDIRPKTITALVGAARERGLSARQLLDPVVGNELLDSCILYVEEEDEAGGLG